MLLSCIARVVYRQGGRRRLVFDFRHRCEYRDKREPQVPSNVVRTVLRHDVRLLIENEGSDV